MSQFYYEADGNLAYLASLQVAVLGYDHLGSTHAQNLRDSGVSVIIGETDTERITAAEEAGFPSFSLAEAVAKSQVVVLAIELPTLVQHWQNAILPHLQLQKLILFTEGLALRHKLVEVPDDIDVALVSLKGMQTARINFEQGNGSACAIAIAQNYSGVALERTLAYTKAVGGLYAGCWLTTFEQQADTNLFAEQAVFSAGILSVLKAGYETLVQVGYQPQDAYFACVEQITRLATGGRTDIPGLPNLTQIFSSDRNSLSNTHLGDNIVSAGNRVELLEFLAKVQQGITLEGLAQQAELTVESQCFATDSQNTDDLLNMDAKMRKAFGKPY